MRTIAAALMLSSIALAGPLTPPPGGVQSTGKTTNQIEPRTFLSQANTPGDADALFVITQPGSYYLEGNIQAPAGRSGIKISTSGVTLDLNGFSITGTSTSPNGIEFVDPSFGRFQQFHIRNGHISGFTDNGISGNVRAAGGTITDITAADNGQNGIAVEDSFVIENCVARNNGRIGFVVNRDCILVDCIARGNGSDGFAVNFINRLDRCHAVFNAGDGFQVGRANRLTNCYAQSNETSGFNLSVDDCVLIACSAYQNDGNLATTVAGFLVNAANTGNTGRHTLIDCVASENDIGFDVNSVGNFLRGNRGVDNRLNNTAALLNFAVVSGNVAPLVTGSSVTASTSAIANINQ
ncbi:MAG: hypothetical protein AAGI17_04190 [Planctomycetota bacterium]